MRQAQSEFGESTYSIPNDENGIPTPFPTLKPRHQIYEQYDFSNIDYHAEKVYVDYYLHITNYQCAVPVWLTHLTG